MYAAESNRVYYYSYPGATRELYLTVHSTKDCRRTPAEQADMIARILNSDASTRYRITGGP